MKSTTFQVVDLGASENHGSVTRGLRRRYRRADIRATVEAAGLDRKRAPVAAELVSCNAGMIVTVRTGFGRSCKLSVLPAHTRTVMQQADRIFDEAFGKAVDLGNRIADKDEKADLWDIADGLLAGAVQYWLYSRQPCGDPKCEECLPIGTAEGRLAELRALITQFAEESEYFHTPNDSNVGRA